MNYKRTNIIAGWIAFAVAAIVYLLSIPPTTSFWDTGEFIATAYKLEVCHSPGSPLFMIIARFFTLFAQPADAALMVNAMSGLASAFTIMFLFWTITHLARKIMSQRGELTDGRQWAILGAGLVGAFAYMFTDTFWFSAVEGEVYALSSLFTAVVFWAILKWENVADEAYANRWLILIAYLVGLSIGVHLLNLLAIPAIVFVFYFRKYKPTKLGVVAAAALSIFILGFIMYFIIPYTVKIASYFDRLFVNGFGLPFNSGVIFFAAALLAALIYGIWYSHKKGKVLANTILLGITVILIGYSSYAMTVIRSSANPPMDQNDPEDLFSLLSYLNREQYGDRPLFYGQYYSAPVEDSKEKFSYRKAGDRYEKYSKGLSYEYSDDFSTFFPRMYSSDRSHVREYEKWAQVEGTKIQDSQGETRVKPTFGENLRFFFSYQVGFMYGRYFMWNFVGRQNDVQGHGEISHGNWLSGIPFIDEARLGDQEGLPNYWKNHNARNTYFFLPLLLGLIGLFYHYNKHRKDFWVIMMLFVLTGIAIVVYLNQNPLQPRERDYAYAGSFYAFSIWIGIGVAALYGLFKKVAPKALSAGVATLITLLFVPGIMAKENWDDHDRSDRYVARDFAYNYLNSCAPNAILFTHGDNDTFPLWYAQEVEGIRTDVRVVNLSLLNTSWYIDQMKRKAYESDPVPFSLKHNKYQQGTRDQVPIMNQIKKHVSVNKVVDFIASDDQRSQLSYGNEKINYMPTNKLKFPVDSATVVENGTVDPKDADKIVPEVKWTLNQNNLMKSGLMILDLLAHNNWERPVYFVSPSSEANLGLRKYLQLEGFAYRLVPIETPTEGRIDVGKINTDKMYENLMNEFRWGNMQDTSVYIDYTIRRTSNVIRIRNKFARLAEALIEKGKKNEAVQVLDKAMELTPHSQFPYNIWTVEVIKQYYNADATDKANKLTEEFAGYLKGELDYYTSLNSPYNKLVDRNKRIATSILYRLSQVTGNNGQNELSKNYSDYLNQVLSGGRRRRQP